MGHAAPWAPCVPGQCSPLFRHHAPTLQVLFRALSDTRGLVARADVLALHGGDDEGLLARCTGQGGGHRDEARCRCLCPSPLRRPCVDPVPPVPPCVPPAPCPTPHAPLCRPQAAWGPPGGPHTAGLSAVHPFGPTRPHVRPCTLTHSPRDSTCTPRALPRTPRTLPVHAWGMPHTVPLSAPHVAPSLAPTPLLGAQLKTTYGSLNTSRCCRRPLLCVEGVSTRERAPDTCPMPCPIPHMTSLAPHGPALAQFRRSSVPQHQARPS